VLLVVWGFLGGGGGGGEGGSEEHWEGVLA